jgi:cytochrome c oxidase subunit 4
VSKNEKQIAGTRTFVSIWIVLVALTGVTVASAQLHWGAWSMFVVLLIASVKASLVLWHFMHLKYEKMLFKMLFLIPITTVTIIIWLTFYDIWYR